jgi:Flp pilus assembly pilin Flp
MRENGRGFDAIFGTFLALNDILMLARLGHKIVARARSCAGSTITEYAIIVAIVSIAGVVLLVSIGQRANALLDQMNTNFPK